ncbi:MAG TPA: DUF2254 domain-containing protein [Frankiaceae bacterium]|nr:DUF2254 domain-containing protein [Frankiaceae bacterium]
MRRRSASRRRWAVVVDALRTQLWPIPAAGVALAVALGVGLTRLDSRIDRRLPNGLTDYLFTGGADAARSVLGAIAGSLITVTSLTFSLTVVTLQLASSQFSPRLLRTFSRDRFVHVTLGLFLATFVYALTVLRTVRSSGGGRALFVPQLSVTVAYLLALASVLFLVLFLAHLARQIRVETMLRNVHTEAEQTAAVMLVPRGDGDDEGPPPRPPPNARPVLAKASGFLTSIDELELLAAAEATRAVIQVDRMPGSLVVEGTPVAFVWVLPGAEPLSDGQFETVNSRTGEAVHMGFERTAAQDVAFALRQLTDVANKALSPGINDPTTAVHALGHSSALLCALTRYQLGDRLLRDPAGGVRVVLRRPNLPALLELAMGQPRRYGAADPDVLCALFWLLRALAWCSAVPVHRDAVAAQLRRLHATVDEQAFDADERSRLSDCSAEVQDALQGAWRAAR